MIFDIVPLFIHSLFSRNLTDMLSKNYVQSDLSISANNFNIETVFIRAGIKNLIPVL